MRSTLLLTALLLAACASTEMRQYVGKDVTELQMAYGAPENVIDLPDGRRAFQYRWGGGAGVIPGQSTSTVQSWGNTATVSTTATPAMAFQSPGCLITYIASPAGNLWTVTDIRVPKQLVC